MRTIGGDEPAWIVATISKPAFGRETCFVGWTTTDMHGSDPGRVGEGHAAEVPRHTLCSCARLRVSFCPSALPIGALFRVCHRHAQHDRTLLEIYFLLMSHSDYWVTSVTRLVDGTGPRSLSDKQHLTVCDRFTEANSNLGGL